LAVCGFCNSNKIAFLFVEPISPKFAEVPEAALVAIIVAP
jgi:hypothetical protein